MAKVAIGFITYGQATAKYLPFFLKSLIEQTFKDSIILAADNTEEEINENSDYLKNNFPEIDLEWAGENIGFARGYNRLINKAIKAGAEYFLALNPDMVLSPDAIEKMLAEFSENEKIGSVSPKIYKWDFENNTRTNTIDSCGIKLSDGLRFTDLGQGETDEGQFDGAKIIGPSGAAAMYKISALEKVKEGDGYFDELMFMYKEDCDLAYRLFLGGFEARLAAGSFIFHDRSVAGRGESDLAIVGNRFRKSKKEKAWSFLNQHIIFLKFWKRQNLSQKLRIVIFAAKMLAFAAIFEPYLLKQYLRLFKIRKYIKMY